MSDDKHRPEQNPQGDEPNAITPLEGEAGIPSVTQRRTVRVSRKDIVTVALTVVPGCALVGRSKVTETSGISGVTVALAVLLAKLVSVIELPEAVALTTTEPVPTKTLTVRVRLALGPSSTTVVVIAPSTG